MYETLSDWKRTHTIDKLPKKFEGRICVMGWIHEKEIINGETVILRLRDSTGSRDFALDRKSTSVDIFEKIRNLTVESVVGIKGKVIESSQLKIKMGEFSFKVFNSAYEPYPVNRNNLDMGSIPLLQKRQFILRNSKMTSILKIRSEVIRAIRKFLHNGCFVEFPTPTMQWGTDPGVRTAHLLTMPDFRETPYVLASSAQLYKQAAVIPLDKVYTIAPALR